MNEQPAKEWWLQNDPVKEGWGPFESEAAAWRHLFGREPSAADIRQHEEAGWYVGFINRWPNVDVTGPAANLYKDGEIAKTIPSRDHDAVTPNA